MSETTRTTVPRFSLDRCKHCGICSHFCPAGAITADDEGTPCLSDPEACTSCRLCERLCPDFAIEMVSKDQAQVATAAGSSPPETDPPSS